VSKSKKLKFISRAELYSLTHWHLEVSSKIKLKRKRPGIKQRIKMRNNNYTDVRKISMKMIDVHLQLLKIRNCYVTCHSTKSNN
jgi:hypothetical protein